MRRLTIIVIMVAFAFCVPARAEILVFKTGTKGTQFKADNQIIEKKNESGYFVINTDLADINHIAVNEVYHLHYEKNGKVKTQFTTILDVNNVELIMVPSGKSITMVMRYFDGTTGTYMAAFGKAKSRDIGNLQYRYVAGGLGGSCVWKQQDYITGSGSISFRLDIKATVLANTQNKTAVQIINEYEQTLAQTKGYTPE